MIKNTLQDKSGISRKIIATAQKLFNYCVHSWRGIDEDVLQVVSFTICDSSDQWKNSLY